MTDKKPAQDDPAQSQRFIEAALEAEAGDDPETFEKVFKELVSKGDVVKKPSR